MTLSSNSEFMLAIRLWHRCSSMAIKSTCDLLRASVDTDSSWVWVIRPQNVIQFRKLGKIPNTAKHAVTIDRPEELVWLAVSKSVLTGVSVATHEGYKEKSKETICALSICQGPITELRVYCVVSSVIILIF